MCNDSNGVEGNIGKYNYILRLDTEIEFSNYCYRCGNQAAIMEVEINTVTFMILK